VLKKLGLISEEGDDDEELDDKDIRKDRALGRVEPSEVVMGSLPQ
jgi:hypothetical protein